jgi:hypothetical protein
MGTIDVPRGICFPPGASLRGLSLTGITILSLLLAPVLAVAAPYSPYLGDQAPRRLLWGDTHLHTMLSLDARGFGVRLAPEEAYRFARGETVSSTRAGPARLSRPLDFLVVADHSDGLGVMNAIIEGDSRLLGDADVQRWHSELLEGGASAYRATIAVILGFTSGKAPAVLRDESFTRSVWEDYIRTADRFNEPGRFTALIGYEWTSTEGGNNLHRNVIYRGDAEAAGMLLPQTTQESFDPRDLWKWMARFERTSGSEVLALAHNGNMSNGLMFPVGENPATGQPLDGEYLRQRARWEPLYEITQIKGDGESHPFLSPNDEYAGHDVPWDRTNLLRFPKEKPMLQYEYAREALKNGLKLQAQHGVNPYRFGVIGSTDSHTGLATAAENNFFGKHTGLEPGPDRWQLTAGQPDGDQSLGWEYLASGYAAVWARENTREAIFDAMKRREVYATTGPRIAVRVFGGWQFAPGDVHRSHFEEVGYGRGVPMGGQLPPREGATAPGFMIAAMKDPLSGNLDRVQVIKGWLDATGGTREQVYDVAWSDPGNRLPGPNGRIPAIASESTVDPGRARWTNSVGATELRTVWTDPDFDARQRAFYYVRVIEIPTPRWTAYDARRFGAEMDARVPMTVRERAYTSPIWYEP